MTQYEPESKGNMHIIVIPEGPAAVGAFARTRGLALFHTILAEDMAACLDRGVFEISTAYRTESKCLGMEISKLSTKPG